jgi:hypothetical protein
MSEIPPPRAPSFKSDEEINRITLDPVLGAFGAGNALFTQITTPAPTRVAFGGSSPQHAIRSITIRK